MRLPGVLSPLLNETKGETDKCLQHFIIACFIVDYIKFYLNQVSLLKRHNKKCISELFKKGQIYLFI